MNKNNRQFVSNIKSCFGHYSLGYIKYLAITLSIYLAAGEINRSHIIDAPILFFGGLFLFCRWIFLLMSKKLDGKKLERLTVLFSPFIVALFFRITFLLGLTPEKIHLLILTPFYIHEINNIPYNEREGHIWEWGSDALPLGPGTVYKLLYSEDNVLPIEYRRYASDIDVRRLVGPFFLIRLYEGEGLKPECWPFIGCVHKGHVSEGYKIG